MSYSKIYDSIPSLIPSDITCLLDDTSSSPNFLRRASFTIPLVTVVRSLPARKIRIADLTSASDTVGRSGMSSSELSTYFELCIFPLDLIFEAFLPGVVLAGVGFLADVFAFFLAGSSYSSDCSPSDDSSSSLRNMFSSSSLGGGAFLYII